MTVPLVALRMPSTTRSERIPSSLSDALQVPVRGSRSVSRRPSPVRRTPEYVVSPSGLTVNDVGTKASASSKTPPKSKSTVVPLARATRVASSQTQNSRNSTRERSMPVAESVCVIERQRGACLGGPTQLGRPNDGDAGRLFASPNTVSGFTISQSTGSADCACPVSRSVGSICCGRNCTGT